MITPRAFAARWKYSPLVRAEPETVASLTIPESSKRFLIEAGLPKFLDGLCFDLIAERMPRITEALEGKYEMPEGFARYRLLGSPQDIDSGYYICLDELAGGSVVSICFHSVRYVGAVVSPTEKIEGVQFHLIPYPGENTRPSIALLHTVGTAVSFYNSNIRQFAECRLVEKELKETVWGNYPYDMDEFRETAEEDEGLEFWQ